MTGWLLDRGPADLRLSDLRTLAGARWPATSRHVLAGELDGTRRAYAAARVELGERVGPDALSVVQAALEAEGARLLQVQREVALVEEALRPTGCGRRGLSRGRTPYPPMMLSLLHSVDAGALDPDDALTYLQLHEPVSSWWPRSGSAPWWPWAALLPRWTAQDRLDTARLLAGPLARSRALLNAV